MNFATLTPNPILSEETKDFYYLVIIPIYLLALNCSHVFNTVGSLSSES